MAQVSKLLLLTRSNGLERDDKRNYFLTWKGDFMKVVIELIGTDYPRYCQGFNNTLANVNVCELKTSAMIFDNPNNATLWAIRYLTGHRWRLVGE